MNVMSDQQQRTQWALDLFREFIRNWAPMAMQGHLTDNDTNDGERVRAAIRDIAPKTDDSRRVGWAVFKREHDTTYDRERPSGYVYTIASSVFEFIPTHALEYCQKKKDGDFVICEIQEIP